MMPSHWAGIFSARNLHQHQLVFHACAQDFDFLPQRAGNLMQSGDVILVMLH